MLSPSMLCGRAMALATPQETLTTAA